MCLVILVSAMQVQAVAAKLAKRPKLEQNTAIFQQVIKTYLQQILVEDALAELEVEALAKAPPLWKEHCEQMQPAIRRILQDRTRPWLQEIVDSKEVVDGFNDAIGEQLKVSDRMLIITALDSGNREVATYLVANNKGLAERTAVLLDNIFEARQPQYLAMLAEMDESDFGPAFEECRSRLSRAATAP